MFSILEFNRKQEKILEQIKDDPSLEYTIREAFLQDVNRVEDVVRPELATNRTIVRFNVLQKTWDSEKTQMLIDAYRTDKPKFLQFFLNRIAATRYLSLWTPDLPIYVSSARFRQRVLERAAYFASEVEAQLNFITALEGSSSNSLAKGITHKRSLIPAFKQPLSKNEYTLTQLSLLSHALPILDTEIKKKEEIFPSHSFQLWKDHERELISTSFEHARTRYEQTTGSSIVDNHLQECIDDFLKGDLL